MNLIYLAAALLILACCCWAAYQALLHADAANEDRKAVDRIVGALREQVPRVNNLERTAESIRRELRTLSGKFYAELRKREDDVAFDADLADDGVVIPQLLPVCQNWKDAKQLGPHSDAAKCECLYCMAQRAERARVRGELVPKTVQGQAETARLNAGKP